MSEVGSGSVSDAPGVAATVGYAAHGGREPLDDPLCGQAANSEDACRRHKQSVANGGFQAAQRMARMTLSEALFSARR